MDYDFDSNEYGDNAADMAPPSFGEAGNEYGLTPYYTVTGNKYGTTPVTHECWTYGQVREYLRANGVRNARVVYTGRDGVETTICAADHMGE